MKGKGTPWTEEEHARLRELYPITLRRKLAGLFGERSVPCICSRAKLLGLRKARERKLWLAADDWMMRAYFPHLRTADIATRFRCTIAAAERRAHNLRLHKNESFLASAASGRIQAGSARGALWRFREGHPSPRKGTKFGIRGRMRETMFRKGQQPHNMLPLWSFRINTEGYLLLKTGKPAPRPNNGWQWVHKLIWEHHHGSVPEGHRLWFKNGDKADCSLGNLECLTLAAAMLRVTIHNPKFPAPLRQVIQLKGALRRRLNRMERESNVKEHDGRPAEPPVFDDRGAAGRREAHGD
jgi:hypothetical protein